MTAYEAHIDASFGLSRRGLSSLLAVLVVLGSTVHVTVIVAVHLDYCTILMQATVADGKQA